MMYPAQYVSEYVLSRTLSLIAQVDRDKSACSKTLRQSSRITYKTAPRFGSAISTLALESPEARPYRDGLGKQLLESAPSSSIDFRHLTSGISIPLYFLHQV